MVIMRTRWNNIEGVEELKRNVRIKGVKKEALHTTLSYQTPYELINDRKLNILFPHVFGALCYPKNDREDIRKLGSKGDIGFFIGYSANTCAYRVYNRSTKKMMETMNVTFDELSPMAFTQRNLLFEAIYDDYIGGQPSVSPRTALAAPTNQVLQTPTPSTTTADTAPTLTNSSSYAANISKHFIGTCESISTLMEIKDKLDLDKNGTLVDAMKYRSMIGALMYLTMLRLLQEYFRWNSILKRKVGELVLEKTRLYRAVNRERRICVSILRYHFIKEHVEKGTIELYFVKTDYQLADLFTKALLVDRFNYLVCHLGMRSLSPYELECRAKSL
ncbi:retrovirus-related pol polyprotein from transposon TNT 1-94 [Tanacetum coccineum]